jgi:hypothetical protein
MSDLNALAQKLTALAGKNDQFDAGARVISQGGVPSPIGAMLNEIDDTVLERNLEFVADDQTINLIVSGRRLRGFMAVTPEVSGAAQVLGKTLARDEPDVVQAASELLSQLCGSAMRMTVRSLPPQPFGTGGDRGISARGLAELWQIDMDEAPQPPMAKFLSANAPAMSAMMHVSDGTVISTSGDTAALQSIWDNQIMPFREVHKQHQDPEGGPQLVCLEGALEDGAAAAMALAGDEIALIAYQPDQLGTMLASWRAITG